MGEILTQFGIDWKIFVWEVVNFLIVLTILYFLIFRTLANILDKRQTVIREGVENAEKAEETLASAETEKGLILRDADGKASETIAASVLAGKERETQIIAEAEEKGAEKISAAKAKGELEKQSIIESSKEDIAKMIVLGAEKVLAQK